MTTASQVRLFACFVFVVGFAPAQFCFTPDGMDGNCCAPVASNVPLLPTVAIPGLGASLLNCGVDCMWNNTTTIAPVQVLCDYWLFSVTIAGATPADPSVPTSLFFGKYARTWGELTPTGPVQVWRWLINGEIGYAPPPPFAPLTACKVPFSALPPFGLPTHFQGHVDYSRDCATGAWEAAFALTHLCPYEAHAAFSAYPIGVPPGTPARTYHFVAPANFAFGPGPSPEGTIIGDAQRSTVLVPGVAYDCLAENPIVGGTLTTPYCDCACSATGFGPATYHHQTLTATVANCGVTESIGLLPLPGFLPTGLRVHMFGSWTAVPGAQNYPGTKHIGHYMGVLVQNDVCPNVAAPLGPLHAVTGVGTAGGHAMILPNPALSATTEAVDLTNMLLFPNLNPGIGGLFVADRVWSFNMT